MANKKIPVNITFAERIKFARKAKGLTQSALAEMIGVTDQVIRAYELGNVGVSKATAIAIATVLGFDMGYFLDENITETRPLCGGVEAYKEIARCCFRNAKESLQVQNAMRDFGVSLGDSSPLFSVCLHCDYPMKFITPHDVYESSEWFEDFWYTDDFEAFWNKYYESEGGDGN